VQYLAPRHARIATWPAISTVADLLKRHNHVAHRRRRRPIVHLGTAPINTTAPNNLWTADFNGQFRTRDGQTPAARYIASPLANFARHSRPRESTSMDANTSWIRTKVRRLIGVPHDNTWTPSR